MKHYKLFKLRAVLLLLVGVLSMPITRAEIIEGTCGINGADDVTWSYDTSTKKLTITKVRNDGDMYNCSGESDQPWKTYRTQISSIELIGVRIIGSNAFSGCRNLSSVVIPSSVTIIRGGAFKGCNSLRSITIPSSVQSIGNNAFEGCYCLSTFTVPSSVQIISDNAFEGCSELSTFTFEDNSSLKSINSLVFKDCRKLKSLTIPSTVTSIKYGAFYGCTRLESLIIPESVKSIESVVFFNCSSLTSITIPAAVESFGSSVFRGCSNLASIDVEASSQYFLNENGVLFNKEKTRLIVCPQKCTNNIIIPASVETIDFYAFENCSELASLALAPGSALTDMGQYAFDNCSGLTSITIPEGVTNLQRVFTGCSSLETVVIPYGITSIGEEAFSGCTSLSSVTIPNSVTRIYNQAFRSCTSLKSIYIPASVTYIYNLAFSGCSNLTSISLPPSVTNLSYMPFAGCNKLTSIFVYTPLIPAIQSDSFDYRNSTSGNVLDDLKIFVFNNLLDEYKNAHNWNKYSDHIFPITIDAQETATGEYCTTYYNDLVNVLVPEGTQVFKVKQDGASLSLTEFTDRIITKGEGVMLKSNSSSIMPVYSETESATSSSHSAMSGGLANIAKMTSTIEGGNTATLGVAEAVDKSSLTGSLIIPEYVSNGTSRYPVTSFAEDAFKDCKNLTSVNIPSRVTSIGQAAFSGCSALSSVSLPSGLTSIGKEAFKDCENLPSVNIPSNVTSIGQAAFSGCSALSSLSLPTGLTSIGKEAFKGTGLTTVEIPYNVESVGESSFEGCSGLVSVELPTNLAIIAKNTFLDCTNMTTVNIPVATTEIKDGAFKNCQKLVAVSLPSGLVELGMGAFEASGLESITLPPGVTAIAASAFKSCQSLVSATLYSPTVATVSDDSFSDNHQDLKIKVPSDLLNAYRGGVSNAMRKNRSAGWSNYSSKIYPITLDLNADPQKATDKWCTYYNDLANMTVPSGTTIYKAQLDQVNNKVMLTEVEGSVVAKGNAVMLKSSSANIELSSATTSDLGTYSDNDLKGGDVTSGYIAYTLAGINGIMGFYRFTGNSLDPNKAHLEVANSNPNNAPQLIPFDNKTTGIMLNTVKADEEKSEWYSLDGRQIQGRPTQKGIYVKKGKKYVVK